MFCSKCGAVVQIITKDIWDCHWCKRRINLSKDETLEQEKLNYKEQERKIKC